MFHDSLTLSGLYRWVETLVGHTLLPSTRCFFGFNTHLYQVLDTTHTSMTGHHSPQWISVIRGYIVTIHSIGKQHITLSVHCFKSGNRSVHVIHTIEMYMTQLCRVVITLATLASVKLAFKWSVVKINEKRYEEGDVMPILECEWPYL